MKAAGADKDIITAAKCRLRLTNKTYTEFSREMGLVKKQLRLHPQFRLAQEFCIQEKNGSYLFIVEKRQ